VGLAAREFEAAGFSTVTLSMIPDFTASVGTPRIAAIEHPFSRPLGREGDAEGQRQVLRATLEVLTTARTPGTVVDLPFEWTEPPRESRPHSKEKPPIVQLLFRKPWLSWKLVSGDIPEPEE
jgi:D-proline reductase (dithiol) PrdB